MAVCAAFREESHMKFANAANPDRKSGLQRLASMKQELSPWPSAHESAPAHGHEERSEHPEPAKRGRHKLQGPLPFSLADSGSSLRTHAGSDTMQNQGCTTSMAWLPWVIAALQVGCPEALKGVFCTAANAPVAGFKLKPDTVWPRKFVV